MTIFAALDLLGLTVADVLGMGALVRSAIQSANADLINSFGGAR